MKQRYIERRVYVSLQLKGKERKTEKGNNKRKKLREGDRDGKNANIKFVKIEPLITRFI